MALNVQPKVDATIGSGDIAFQLDVTQGDYIFQGFTVSTNTSVLVSIASGSGALKGFLISEDATGTLTVASSATNYVYVVLTLNASNKPTSVAYVATTAETQTNGYRLAKVISTANVSSVSMEHSMTNLTQVEMAARQLEGLF